MRTIKNLLHLIKPQLIVNQMKNKKHCDRTGSVKELFTNYRTLCKILNTKIYSPKYNHLLLILGGESNFKNLIKKSR